MDLQSIIETLIDQFNRENYGAFYLAMRWRPMTAGKRPPLAILIMSYEPLMGEVLIRTHRVELNDYRRHFYPHDSLRGIIQGMKGDLQNAAGTSNTET